MALRAVVDHPKFFRLKAALGLPRYAALGLLETLWHFTGRFCPHGDIGKYSDVEIECWLEWTDKPGALIPALLNAGWLDPHPTHRLVVHDWHRHADDATKLAVKRSGLQFVALRCGDTVATPSRLPGAGAGSGSNTSSDADTSSAPRNRVSNPKAKPLAEQTIFQAYPRQVGVGAAIPAIRAAIERLTKGEVPLSPMTTRDAQVYLLRRVEEYAQSPMGSQPDKKFLPYGERWFDESRYLDDSAEWQLSPHKNGAPPQPKLQILTAPMED